jgi:ferritin
MTELLQQVIAQIEQLPIDRQDAIAARFLAELAEEQQAENVWVEDVRTKIDAAISASEQTPPIDGETFINQILERFQRDRSLLRSIFIPCRNDRSISWGLIVGEAYRR